MKKLFSIIGITSMLAFAGFMLTPLSIMAEEPLPACATNGDLDSDGVFDIDDSDETDSCLASSTGLEDCSTGAGDGVPDCQVY